VNADEEILTFPICWCRVYQETVEKARTDNLRIVGEAKAGIVECEKALCRLTAMERDISSKREQVAHSVAQVRGVIVYIVYKVYTGK
jgi:hypothetical protein